MKLRNTAIEDLVSNKSNGINIQFFAEGGEGTGTGQGTGEGDSQNSAEEEPKTFDEWLNKNKSFQSEFDKRIAKALETAKTKWYAEYEKKLEDVKTEAQKLAKMNAEEKAKYEQEKREAEYQKRLRNLTTRELKAEAYETIAEKGLPKELVEILNYESAETVKASMEAVEKAFQTAVEKAVNEKLRGKGAPRSGNDDGSSFEQALRKAMGIKE